MKFLLTLLALTTFAFSQTKTISPSGGGLDPSTNPSFLTGLGATTAGRNLLTLPNQSAIRFLLINADNTISTLTDSDFRTAIGSTSGTGLPLVADFTTGWINQQTRTASDTSSGIMLHSDSATGSQNVTMLLKPLSVASTWTYTANVSLLYPAAGYASGGLVLRESSSGKLTAFVMTAGGGWARVRWDSPTIFVGDDGATGYNPSAYIQPILYWMLKLENNGTNIIFSISGNYGASWIQVYSNSKTNFCIPDQIGICANPNIADFTLLVSKFTGP